MAIEPAHVERHPVGYDWRARLPGNHRLVAFGEGSATYAADVSDKTSLTSNADGDDAYWIVVDEGSLADLLDPVRDADVINTLVQLHRFDDPASWEAAIAQRQAQLTPQQRRLVELHGAP